MLCLRCELPVAGCGLPVAGCQLRVASVSCQLPDCKFQFVDYQPSDGSLVNGPWVHEIPVGPPPLHKLTSGVTGPILFPSDGSREELILAVDYQRSDGSLVNGHWVHEIPVGLPPLHKLTSGLTGVNISDKHTNR